MKIACIYHSVDLDGWMSAAIVEHWFHQYCFEKDGQKQLLKSKENDLLVAHDDILTFIGYNYGESIAEMRLHSYDKIIMCDISLPKHEMLNLYGAKQENFIWIDHHVSAINEVDGAVREINLSPIEGNRHIRFAACELTWFYFFGNDKPLPEIVHLLGRYDCFGHKGTHEKELVLQFQYGARSVIPDHSTAYSVLKNSIGKKGAIDYITNLGAAIYDYLKQEANQKFSKRFTLQFGEYYFAAINAERLNPVNFGINYHSYKADDIYFYDGVASFWITSSGIYFSLYNDNGKVDCSKIAANYGGGGHAGASGFFMPFYGGAIDNVLIQDFKAKLASILYVGRK